MNKTMLFAVLLAVIATLFSCRTGKDTFSQQQSQAVSTSKNHPDPLTWEIFQTNQWYKKEIACTKTVLLSSGLVIKKNEVTSNVVPADGFTTTSVSIREEGFNFQSLEEGKVVDVRGDMITVRFESQGIQSTLDFRPVNRIVGNQRITRWELFAPSGTIRWNGVAYWCLYPNRQIPHLLMNDKFNYSMSGGNFKDIVGFTSSGSSQTTNANSFQGTDNNPPSAKKGNKKEEAKDNKGQQIDQNEILTDPE